MGQKVHPLAYRLGINKDWESRWFNLKEMPRLIVEDENIRKFIRKRVGNAGIARIDIERMGENVRITIRTDKPGVIIGKGGAEVENLKSEIDDMTKKNAIINIEQIKNSRRDARLVAEGIASALEKKMRFRAVLKKTIDRVIQEGAEGVKIAVSGRLNGAEIARTEWMKEGRIPLQTIRADIDYGFCEAKTAYGNIGIKVWVCNGQNFSKKQETESAQA
jgi:small subunit ribosomal protein S3